MDIKPSDDTWIHIKDPEDVLNFIKENNKNITEISFANNLINTLTGFNLINIILNIDSNSKYDFLRSNIKIKCHDCKEVNDNIKRILNIRKNIRSKINE